MVNRSIFSALISAFLLFPTLLMARGGKELFVQVSPHELPPWLTGTLIAPSPRVVPAGHFTLEPYIYVTAYHAEYGSDWKSRPIPTFLNTQLQIPMQIGLTSWMDIEVNPILNWNYAQHKSAWRLGDLPIDLDIQLYRSHQNSPIPNTKLVLKENVPLAKYRDLNPSTFPRYLVDGGGVGTWATTVGVVFGNLYHFSSVYYFSYRFYLNYTLPAPVKVKGFNYYGGGYGADARVFPGRLFQFDLGFELTLAQTWAFALDIIGDYEAKTRYSGTAGIDFSGQPSTLGGPASIQYSLAPAIEYNFNDCFGIITGGWFTFAGKNSLDFVSAIMAINYYYQ